MGATSPASTGNSPPKLVTVISSKDSQRWPGAKSGPVIVHRKVVVPA